jgi:hypothetical protein
MKLNINILRALALILAFCAVIVGTTRGVAAGVAVFVLSGLAIELLRRTPTLNFTFAYLGTTIADIFIPSVYGTIQPNDSPERTAFASSGVAVTNEVLQSAAQSGAKLVDVPIWQDLDPSVEPNYSNDTDTNATPGKVTANDWKARNAFMNKGYGAADLTTELAKSTPGQGDPMTRIRNRFGTYWARQFQYRIIAACSGILAKDIATYSSDMLFDIAIETGLTATAANKISADAVIAAVFTLGDMFEVLRAIAMHSVVYRNLVSQQLIDFIPDASGSLTIPTYLGKRLIVDDGMTVVAGATNGFKYTTILFGAGAIGYGEGAPKVPFEVDRIAAGGNGGGLENIWERKTWMIHPAGWHWTDTTITGIQSATLADLRLAANWLRPTGIVRKSIPMAFLRTNG